MADFRKYSEKYPFRQRSETPEIAVELSLQPWRRFGVDGVIMFSGSLGRRSTLLPVIPLLPIIIVGCQIQDILTPLPAMGIDFTIIEGKGPKIISPIKDQADVEKVRVLENIKEEVPFLGPILQVSLSYSFVNSTYEGETTLL